MTDEDQSVLAQGFTDYLGSIHNVIPMENDPEVLQENLFYRNVEYIVQIPADFYETCILGDTPLKVTKVPGSYSSYYVDQQISSFINSARVRAAAGFAEEEIADALEKQEKPQVELADLRGNAGEMPAFPSITDIWLIWYCVLCAMSWDIF